MSGHSKWHNIKIKKSKTDQQRGKLFSKLAREIIIAAKAGGGDPAGNVRLRAAIDRAREALGAHAVQQLGRGLREVVVVRVDELNFEFDSNRERFRRREWLQHEMSCCKATKTGAVD